MAYPPNELRLGLQTHAAPRVIQLSGAVSGPTPGCMQSVEPLIAFDSDIAWQALSCAAILNCIIPADKAAKFEQAVLTEKFSHFEFSP